MNIVQVCPAYFPSHGGVERHVAALSEHLARRGHRVAVATMAGPGEPAGQEVVRGVNVRRFRSTGAGHIYRVPLGLRTWLAAADADVVHVHNYHGPMLVAAGDPKKPLVVTPHFNDRAHSSPAQILHKPYGVLARRVLRAACTIICVSGAERERVQRLMRAGIGRAPRFVVIPNGVDETAPQPKEPGRLLVVSRLERYKRVDEAVAALPSLPGCRLTVVGEGPERTRLERQAARLGVADRVELVGRVGEEELAHLYAISPVLLNLSQAEAFGLSVLEGVAAGCTAVCSDIPAFRELAAQFPGGVLLTQSRSVASTVRQALQGGLNVDQAASRLGPYRWPHIAERVEEVYASCA